MFDTRLFPLDRWLARLPELASEYRQNQPCAHIHLADLLDTALASQLMQEFPGPDEATWIQYKHYNENKLGKSDRADFPPLIGRVIDALSSAEFTQFLSKLTGIEGLMADPSLEGGGMHQTECGGFLNVHTDFSHHHHEANWRRRCNLILYLNEGWEPEWGGAIEFWDKDMKQCVRRVPPLLNHAVIFNTTNTSFHGYPDPIRCPPSLTRKSLALYYYTVDEPSAVRLKSTTYRARPGDGVNGLLIALDTKLVALYSRVKRTFGLSDRFASKVLGCFGRKKK